MLYAGCIVNFCKRRCELMYAVKPFCGSSCGMINSKARFLQLNEAHHTPVKQADCHTLFDSSKMAKDRASQLLLY